MGSRDGSAAKLLPRRLLYSMGGVESYLSKIAVDADGLLALTSNVLYRSSRFVLIKKRFCYWLHIFVINGALASAAYFKYFKTRSIHCCDLMGNRFLVNHRTISNTGSIRGNELQLLLYPVANCAM